jgi:SAM-dependent methyltransferase
MDAANFKSYDIGEAIAEIYDQTETQIDDVRLLRELIGTPANWRILEPFCGNGRILIPLARDGHELVGIDQSKPMLNSARRKIRRLAADTQIRVSLVEADVMKATWPREFDCVILGGNCLYELPNPEAQSQCIRAAARSLKPGGYLYLDNDHMEGSLDPSWCQKGVEENRFPTGVCADGTQVRGTVETTACDVKRRIVRFRRTAEITTPEGQTVKKTWVEQKHPPSTEEMRSWLSEAGFQIVHLWGDRQKSPYTDETDRAVFWARLTDDNPERRDG